MKKYLQQLMNDNQNEYSVLIHKQFNIIRKDYCKIYFCYQMCQIYIKRFYPIFYI